MLLIFDGTSPPPPEPPAPVIRSTYSAGVEGDGGVTLAISLKETAFVLDTTPYELTPKNLFFTVEGDDVRASWDGSNPTAVEGHRFYSGQQIGFTDFKHFDKFALFTTGTSSTVRLTIEGD